LCESVASDGAHDSSTKSLAIHVHRHPLSDSMISMMSSAKEKNPPADNEMHLDAAGGKSAKEIKGWSVHAPTDVVCPCVPSTVL